MIIIRFLFFIFCLALFVANNIEACTLFAANGDCVDGRGSIIAKNRDFQPQNQEVRLVKNGKYAYYGLFSENEKGKWSVKAGVNEKGFVVVSAMSSCIPQKQRLAMAVKPFMSSALKNYATVEEFLEHKNELLGPRFIMIADFKEIACIEVGDKGETYLERKQNDILFHTNHYLNSDMQDLNIDVRQSSLTRLERIRSLLKQSTKPLDLNSFVTFSQDQNAGPNNSIWRIGEPGKSQSLASFIVELIPDNDFRLYLKYRPRIDMQGKEHILVLTKENMFN